jgi:hypothetical protein
VHNQISHFARVQQAQTTFCAHTLGKQSALECLSAPLNARCVRGDAARESGKGLSGANFEQAIHA